MKGYCFFGRLEISLRQRMFMKPIVITGGPGAGKTSIIADLAKRGYLTFEESPRYLIEQQLQQANGILPWTHLSEFAEMCLDMMQIQKCASEKQAGLSFLDRAIPDICAYLQLGKLVVDKKYVDASNGYLDKVFFCSPNQLIYTQDTVRPHAFSEALEIHQLLLTCYRDLGYLPIEVPWGSVEDRANFILEQIG